MKTDEKLDKDRFRRDLGGEVEAYQEVARRLGLLPEDGEKAGARPGQPPQEAGALGRHMALPRVRVVTLNAALGPLDYRVPEGMAVEPGSCRRRAVGTAPTDRRSLGSGPLAQRGSRRQSPSSAGRAGRRSADSRAAAPALRMDCGLLSRAACGGAANGNAVVGGAGRRRARSSNIARPACCPLG